MIKVLRPGLMTTVQDLGRTGYQKYGVITSGAMDSLAHRIANLLVGNNETEAALEITLIGPAIQFEEDALIAITGGDLSPAVDGKQVRSWRPVFVKKGTRLDFKYAVKGCRAYLAVAGGIDVPIVMGSKSTYLRAAVGGYKGRALQAGDSLLFGPCSTISKKIMEHLSGQCQNKPFAESSWAAAEGLYPSLENHKPIRTMKGPQFYWFQTASQADLFEKPFSVTTESDRMGYRLKGPSLHLKETKEMVSEAINTGSIQVPPDGNPIILLADRQSVGGYPKIGQIASADLPLIAQTKPGETISFEEISLEEAQELSLEMETSIEQLKQGIHLKITQEES
ncbi:biotin-dependent carboxyltransferase family protein [Siminovitchia sp. 179-K 8D1 HS]|uniref:5-oxoprolinase subunit C family protein n=1 Tax=Siminovitchia sp. 179-K 8D1 HS TaxID=3142385 RepID=UPI0039A2322F